MLHVVETIDFQMLFKWAFKCIQFLKLVPVDGHLYV